MIYRNTKTGVVIDSPCDLSGGDWVLEGQEIPVKESPKKEDLEPIKERKEEEQEKSPVFSTFTVAELKDYAVEHGIDLGHAKRKEEMIAVLTSAE